MKTIKKFAVISLCIICAPLLCSAQSMAEPTNKPDILHPQGLLWKIEKPGIRPSYLFGTMHVSDERVTSLPVKVETAFLNAQQFVMEMLLNFKAIGLVSSASFFNDGNSLAAIMSPDDYQRLNRLLAKRLQLTEEAVRYMKPWAVLMTLMMPADQQMGAPPLDMQLFRRATQKGIPVAGLETPQEQVDVFDKVSLSDQVWLLNRAVEEIDKTDAQWDNMLAAYLRRDLAQLVMIQQAAMYADSEIDDLFMARLVDKRNQLMAERMQPYLQKGRAFIAIGALHLPGENGVLHLLEKQGYSVAVEY